MLIGIENEHGELRAEKWASQAPLVLELPIVLRSEANELCAHRRTPDSLRHMRHLLKEFVAHYQTERYHQGIGGQLVSPRPSRSNDNGQTVAIQCRSRLGGLLNFYHRAAA